jgi:ATP-dependent DNA helicase RecG
VTGTGLPARFAGGRFEWPPPVTRLSVDPTALERPLAGLPGVGKVTARRLAGFGLTTVGDLIDHFPRRYEDFRDRKDVRDLKLGEEATVRGVVERVSADRTARKRVTVVRAVVRDGTGAVEATWFNQGYLTRVLEPGVTVSVRGTFRPQGGRATFLVRSHEILGEEDGETVHTEGLVPVYPASEQVSARLLRAVMQGVRGDMRRLADPLPPRLRVRERLPGRADATLAVHQPRTPAEAKRARERLVLEELLLMQVGLLLHKRRQQERVSATAFDAPAALSAAFLEGLPFELTEHQRGALAEIEADLRSSAPMRRLLQGDVGSGKTVVALHCLLRAVECGLQGALMAPTETLAGQHAETAAALAGGLASVELLTAALGARERREALARVASGQAQIVIGTHALLQEDVAFGALGLLVVDEQHRFGVQQRDELVRRAERAGRAPHVLHMTATPIPRTLALTVYGDLDVTTIAGLPEGRQPVVTRLVEETRRAEGYDFVRRQLRKGRQVFVVCPAIDESDSISAATAVAEAERLRKGEFREFPVAVVHGQLKPAEREAVMASFKAGEVAVLVATSLVEVGIDVPNASVMMVEGAERFGLAQLHQLRGRVGRGWAKSYCLLFASAETGTSMARLGALLETNDGFELADRDLEIRGEGQVMGTRQAGVPDLKLARLARDREALLRARTLAAEVLAADHDLERPENVPLRDAVEAAFGDELAWLLRA